MSGMDEARRNALAAWLGVEITAMSLMSGGAIQQNWKLDAVRDGVPQAWVLRTDAAATLAVSRSRVEEFHLLKAAFAAGVTVPEPLLLCTDLSVIGAPFFVMRRVDGIAAGFRVVKSETLGGGRENLAASLGRELARIHAIPPNPDLDFLPHSGEPHVRFVAAMRARLDQGRLPRPMLEWGLRHLERTMPSDYEIVMCHNDYRTGNYMVSDPGITGVLDWEFAAWGDPHEDLGWLCAKCWRFGSAYEVGGVGPRAPFYAAYEAASGRRVDAAKMRWWELAATIRWAVIAIDQAERHVSGQEPSLELALTGHIVPELELDVMRATA
jgi:aminoglycoside phosphotransferase (APT) family kinase protein